MNQYPIEAIRADARVEKIQNDLGLGYGLRIFLRAPYVAATGIAILDLPALPLAARVAALLDAATWTNTEWMRLTQRSYDDLLAGENDPQSSMDELRAISRRAILVSS